jgi:ubiquitin-like protein Pup
MAEQERRTRTRPAPTETEEPMKSPELARKGEKLKKSIDEVIDEIDEILEANAEEFVKSYVQRGGE